MATIDFNKPVVTDLRAAVLQEIRDYMRAQALMHDSGDTLTNTPTNLVKFNRTTGRFEQWNGASFIPLVISEVNNSFAVKAGASLGLSVQNSSATPYGIELLRTDTSNSSKVRNGGGFWSFEHRPQFNGNLAWDAGNFNPTSYAALAGATFSGLVDQSATGARYYGLNATDNTTGQRRARVQLSADGSVVLGAVNDANSAITRGLVVATSGALQTVAGDTLWHSGNDGAASGLDADTLDGFNSDAAATANTIALRDASGRLFVTNISQSSANSENPTISQVMVTNGSDGQARKASIAHLRLSLPLSSLPQDLTSFLTSSVGGTLGYVALRSGDGTRSGYLEFYNEGGTRQGYVGYMTDGGSLNYTTDTGGAHSFNAPVVSTGMLRGNSGSKGFGAITTTTSTSTPTGGSSGDFHLIY